MNELIYKRIPLSDTQNLRDLGGYATKDGVTRWQVFFRSACPDSLNDGDGELLKKLGITTVIDFRGGGNFDERMMGYSVLKGLKVHNLPLGNGDPPRLVTDVPYSYLEIAESPLICDVFKIMANADGAVLFHCFAGKDRTGVVAALLLLLAGVADVDIVADYTLSYAYFLSRIRLDLSRLDAEPDVFKALPDHMEGFLRVLREKYGDVFNYMDKIGVSKNEVDSILNKFVVKNA